MLKYLVAGFLFLGLWACAKNEEGPKNMEKGAHEMPGHEGHRHGAEAVKEEGAALRTARAEEVGKNVVCPVMGSKFMVKANTEVADYRGKSYYFCCGGCPAEFMKNPDKYAK